MLENGWIGADLLADRARRQVFGRTIHNRSPAPRPGGTAWAASWRCSRRARWVWPHPRPRAGSMLHSLRLRKLGSIRGKRENEIEERLDRACWPAVITRGGSILNAVKMFPIACRRLPPNAG